MRTSGGKLSPHRPVASSCWLTSRSWLISARHSVTLIGFPSFIFFIGTSQVSQRSSLFGFTLAGAIHHGFSSTSPSLFLRQRFFFAGLFFGLCWAAMIASECAATSSTAGFARHAPSGLLTAFYTTFPVPNHALQRTEAGGGACSVVMSFFASLCR